MTALKMIGAIVFASLAFALQACAPAASDSGNLANGTVVGVCSDQYCELDCAECTYDPTGRSQNIGNACPPWIAEIDDKNWFKCNEFSVAASATL